MHLSHIPQYTTLEQKCAHFCSNVVYCGIWNRCTMGLLRLVYWINPVLMELDMKCEYTHICQFYTKWIFAWIHICYSCHIEICRKSFFSKEFISYKYHQHAMFQSNMNGINSKIESLNKCAHLSQQVFAIWIAMMGKKHVMMLKDIKYFLHYCSFVRRIHQ